MAGIGLQAGVLVAPTAVILSENDRTGRLTIQNPSDTPKEVTIKFAFGLPESDSLGIVKVRIQDSAEVDHPRSAIGWIKAFPRRIVLAPNASQVVRFVANPPKDLEDGEYWARIMVRSQESQPNIPSPEDENKITTRLNMIMQTAIILKYRTGNLVAKLEVANSQVEKSDTAAAIIMDLVNLGNVSYVGILKCRLKDGKQKEIAKRHLEFAVYKDIKRRISLPLPDNELVEPLEFEISISTEGRKDISSDDLIEGNVIEFTKVIE
jgi:P pilus assembly chaperone PapD